MNIAEVKQKDLTQILAMLGLFPTKTRRNEWLYFSPFRKEKVPSFSVTFKTTTNGKIWVWNDFGDSGGTVIDFLIRYDSNVNSPKEALNFLNQFFSTTNFKAIYETQKENSTTSGEKPKSFHLDEVLPLKSEILEIYLTERKINIKIAKKYLHLIRFHHPETEKQFFAFGLQNISGGYEVRNRVLKASIGSKNFTFIQGAGSSKAISVFEGFMDFLSFLTETQKEILESDVLILNSIGLIESAKNFIFEKGYFKIFAFTDNDRAGESALKSLQELPIEVAPCNQLYQGFKDYNEFIMSLK